MVNKILNEKEYAEKCLKEYCLDKAVIPTLIILIKYWYQQGLERDEVMMELDSYMTKAYGDYCPQLWIEKFEKLVKQYYSDAYCLSEVDEIYLSEQEVGVIKKVKGKEKQMVLFTILVHCKINNAKKGVLKNRVRLESSTIYSSMGLKRNNTVKELTLHKLSQEGYISFPRYDATNIDLSYIDLETDFSIEDNRAMTISKTDNILMSFNSYFLGTKIIECEVCQKRVEVKGNARTKYCVTCAIMKKREKTLISNKKKKSSVE